LKSRWLDVSRPIYPGMPVWPGDPPVTSEPVSQIADGQVSNVTRWTLSSHVGTHVDPPLHFEPGGGSVEAMSPDVLCGTAAVIDFRDRYDSLSASDLVATVPSSTTRLLLHTANSHSDSLVFHEDYVALMPDAARWIVQSGIKMIGVDGPSVEAFLSHTFEVHHILLRSGVAILEGLDLSGIETGWYDMVCAPILMRNGDGAPARVFLKPCARDW